MRIFDQIGNVYFNPELTTSVILSLLLMVFLLSAYEFVVYRLVSRRSFYDRSFNISIALLPFFIATIIICLQANIVITLGTIGALAILRFRTAVKDPVDMLYLLWSVHIGITCGCQLYEVAVLTSLVVTIVLFILERVSFWKKPDILLFHVEPEREQEILDKIGTKTRHSRVISRKYSPQGADLVVSFSSGDIPALTAMLREAGIEQFSVLEDDADSIL